MWLSRPRAACSSEIEHFLEARFAAVVRVRNLIDSRVGRKLQEQAHPLSILCGCAAPQVRQVGTIHRQDEIESLEILAGDLARAQSTRISRPRRRAAARAR